MLLQSDLPPGPNIRLPNKWRPRAHQARLWAYMEQDIPGLRAVAVWHRRAGKDSTGLNVVACKSQQRVGTYWHMLPEAAQGRKVIWDGIDANTGVRFIDQAFPVELRKRTIEDEMKIEFLNGSIYQVVGSDNYNSLIGANPIGVIFSEFSVAKPAAWDYIRPILRENGGWAMFLYTPRGKNHGKRLFDTATRLMMEEKGWFAELLTVEDTGLVSKAAIEEERDSGMSDEMIDQEYYCSFEGAIEGAYYSKELKKIREEGRLSLVPHAVGVPVNTFWDIGHDDTNAIWFHQHVGIQHRFIHSYENSGEGLAHYFGYMQRLAAERGYLWGRHFLPHDAETITVASATNKDGRNTRELLENMGLRDIVIVPRIDDVTVGIELTRQKLSQAWFDLKGCEAGFDALGQYHKQWDEKAQTWRKHPHHDWSSNYADALRQWAQGFEPARGTSYKPRKQRNARTV